MRQGEDNEFQIKNPPANPQMFNRREEKGCFQQYDIVELYPEQKEEPCSSCMQKENGNQVS